MDTVCLLLNYITFINIRTAITPKIPLFVNLNVHLSMAEGYFLTLVLKKLRWKLHRNLPTDLFTTLNFKIRSKYISEAH